MKKKVESIEDKPIEKFFNQHLKMKLIQQIENKDIFLKQLKLSCGNGKAILKDFKKPNEEKVKSKKQ